MKLFLLSLALIVTAHLAFAQTNYTTLTSKEANSTTIQSLKYFGWKYVLEKGIFQSSGFPLENGSWLFLGTDLIERRIADEVTYYRFTVRLGWDYSDKLTIRAKYIVSNRPANGRFVVESWVYTEIASSDSGVEVPIGGPEFVDIRPFNNGTSNQSSLLDYAVTATVDGAIEEGVLPEANYSLRYVYSVETEPTYPPLYVFLVSLVSSGDDFYRAQIEISDDSVLGNGEQSPPTYTINPVFESD